MKTSESIQSIAEALSKAQGEILGIPKEAKNDFFNSSYADLDGVREAIRPVLAKNGLSIVQEISSSELCTTQSWDIPVFDRDGNIVTNQRDSGSVSVSSSHLLSARIMHLSGEWIEFEPMRIPVSDPHNPQKVKSGITYMRRAQLLSILNLAEADDDGNTAVDYPAPPLKTIPNYAPRPKAAPGELTMPFGKTKGTKLTSLPLEEVERAIHWAKSKGKFLDWAADAEAFISATAKTGEFGPPNDFGPPPADGDSIPF